MALKLDGPMISPGPFVKPTDWKERGRRDGAASLPPKKQEEVSPMCPVRCVTYVSETAHKRLRATSGSSCAPLRMIL